MVVYLSRRPPGKSAMRNSATVKALRKNALRRAAERQKFDYERYEINDCRRRSFRDRAMSHGDNVAANDGDDGDAATEPSVRRDPKTQDPRHWKDDGWSARIVKNEDDDGWAVEMTKDGAREPALVGPWTMGRNKKDPKPLDTSAFHTLVKTATEFVSRSEQQRHATLNKDVRVNARINDVSTDVRVALAIIPDDDFPYATLTATDAAGDMLAQVKAPASFKLSAASAVAWIEGGFRTPG